MGDAVYNALDSFERFMDHTPFFPTVLWFAMAIVAGMLSTLVHEVGHARAARREGVPVRVLASEPEGPALTLRHRGTYVRIGLGLGRDLKSREPLGFVVVDLPDWLDPHAVIRILRAGPVAQGGYGLLLLFIAAMPLPTFPRVLLALNGVASVMRAAYNLSRANPGSDGALIAAIRDALASTAWEDPHAATSTPPPGG